MWRNVMENEKSKPVFLRPADKSLEAYKEWIAAIYKALTGKEPSRYNRSEEHWVESHKKFWGQ
jgi:hypothetical protein